VALRLLLPNPTWVEEWRREGCQRDAMHYHVVLVETDRERARHVATFERWAQAERHAEVLSTGGEDWLPKRYPGRSWRAGEVTAYLDRRVLHRGSVGREVSVVRCPGAGRELQSECYSFGIAAAAREQS
jgi:hypothetical protein